MLQKPSIGVFICHCGGNISDTVDVRRVKETIGTLDQVKVAETCQYLCSNPGQEMIKKAVKENGLERVIVASCSPTMHMNTFRQVMKSAGLNPYLFEMVNIREQCSWVHDNKIKATNKAIALIRAAVQKARYLEPLTPKKIKVNKTVLVIGGGIAGIYSALELADKGYQVYLVERNPSIGGHMAQLSKTFPTFDCSACILTPKMVSLSHNPNIKVFTNAEPILVKGSSGRFEVTIKVKPRYVNPDKCTACEECAEICPVEKPNSFEENLVMERAIHLPFKQAIPSASVIDNNYCLYLTDFLNILGPPGSRGLCGRCEKNCKSGAINLGQKEKILDLKVGAIIVCTGFSLMDPVHIGQYSFGLHPDIVTNLQFERLMLQGLHKPSTGEEPKKVAFILCVGSRSETSSGVSYCCKIGCMTAIKQALLLDKAVPCAEAWIFYTDVRAFGKGYEEFYAKAREHIVPFIRGRAAEVIPNGSSLIVKATDTLLGKQIEKEFDLVVLSPALVPNRGTKELADILGINLGPDGFFLEAHHKLKGVDSKRKGIFLAGADLGPKDIRETTMEAMAAASKVATFLGKGEKSVSPEVAYLIPGRCDLCGVCVDQCPSKAIHKGEKEVVINSISCNGCGICIPLCPKEALDLKNTTEEQLIAEIQGIVEGDDKTLKIIAFVQKRTAYGSIDLGGQNRRSYSPEIRIIKVPGIARLGFKHVLHAFAAGADGIIFVGGDDSASSRNEVRGRVRMFKKDLRKFGIRDLRLQPTVTTLPEYEKTLRLFDNFVERVKKMAPITQEKREEIRKYLEDNKIVK